jgi:hypothetical protein
LIEVDLLRRGTRSFNHPRLPDTPYLVSLTRAEASMVELWPIGLRDRLPIIPIPLKAPDSDVSLDLALALASVYDEAAYDLSLDYRQSPPPPTFSQADQTWIDELLTSLRES